MFLSSETPRTTGVEPLYTGRAEIGNPNCTIGRIELHPALEIISERIEKLPRFQIDPLFPLLEKLSELHPGIAHLIDHLATVSIHPRLPDNHYFFSQSRTKGDPDTLFGLTQDEAYPINTTVTGGRKIVEQMQTGSYFYDAVASALALIDPYYTDRSKLPAIIRLAYKNMGDTKNAESYAGLVNQYRVLGRGTAEPREISFQTNLAGTHMVYDRYGKLVPHRYSPSRVVLANFFMERLAIARDDRFSKDLQSGRISILPTDTLSNKGTVPTIQISDMHVQDSRFPLMTGENQLAVEALVELGGPDMQEVISLLSQAESLDTDKRQEVENDLYKALAISVQHIDCFSSLTKSFIAGDMTIQEFRVKIWAEVVMKVFADMQVEVSHINFGVNRTLQNRGFDGPMRDPDDSTIRPVPIDLEALGLEKTCRRLSWFQEEIAGIAAATMDARAGIMYLIKETKDLSPHVLYLLAESLKICIQKSASPSGTLSGRTYREELELLWELRENPFYAFSWDSYTEFLKDYVPYEIRVPKKTDQQTSYNPFTTNTKPQVRSTFPPIKS